MRKEIWTIKIYKLFKLFFNVTMYFRLVPDNRHHLTLPYNDLASIECISPFFNDYYDSVSF